MLRWTRLGILLLASGGFCFVLAVALHTLAPAFLGLALVSLVLTVTPPHLTVTAERTIPERGYSGEPFTVVTVARGPPGAPLFIESPTPMGARLVSSDASPGRGTARLEQTFMPASPGVLTFPGVRVRVQDPWGVVEDAMTVPLRDHLPVAPSSASLVEGRRLGLSATFTRRSKSTIAADDEPEVERLREGQPGDRLRDIDWAATSRFGRLIVRQMSHEPLRPVVVLMDATPTMRIQRRDSKLQTAVNAGLSVATAAQVAGVPIGLVAWSERGVEVQVSVAGSRRVLTTSMARLSGLPPAEAEITRTRAPEIHAEVPVLEERRFLAAAATFSPHARGAATPLESALEAVSKASPQPSLVLAFLDVEEQPQLAQTVIKRLRQRGHHVIVIGLVTGAHHYSLKDADMEAVAHLVEWRRNRDRARSFCLRQRVPFHVLGPRTTTRALSEVVRSAR